MNRRPTTQDITWLLDLNRNAQLDLDPPYQRKSVWTRKDRQFFLDTIFRDYPSPAIFLHKTIAEDGSSTYHVVDGKQRLETILSFVNNKLRIAKDFGDVRLDGKNWTELEGEHELKKKLWNYQIPVEMVDVIEGNVVNEVFDRLNRNSRRLTEQELRHAKFDGWFITTAEAEEEKDSWKKLGIVTTARAKRMADTQFISELLMVVINGGPAGFDQDAIDAFYGKYDETESVEDFNEEIFSAGVLRTKEYLLEMEKAGKVITRYARTLAHFYTLWSVIALNADRFQDGSDAPATAAKYQTFMELVEAIAAEKDAAAKGAQSVAAQNPREAAYYENSRGASTDLKPRQERQRLLAEALLS
jgi:hypothetical protein